MWVLLMILSQIFLTDKNHLTIKLVYVLLFQDVNKNLPMSCVMKSRDLNCIMVRCMSAMAINHSIINLPAIISSDVRKSAADAMW